jgi:hypothetical protein
MHLVLHLQVFDLEEMHHPRDPPLLLSHLLNVVLLLPSSSSRHLPRVGPHAHPRMIRDTAISLIPYEDVAEVQDALDVLGGLDDRLVLENGGDDSVGDGASSRVRLDEEEFLV